MELPHRERERDSLRLEPLHPSLKVPVNEPLPASPAGPLLREMPLSRAFNFVPFIHLSKSLVYGPLLGSPTGPQGKRYRSPEPSCTYSSGSPVKKPPLQVPVTEVQCRKMLFFLNHLSTNSQSSGKQTPLIILLSLIFPENKLHPCFPTGSLWREMLHLPSQCFIHSFINVRVPS